MTHPLWRLARELRARPVAIEPRAFAAIDAQLAATIEGRLAGLKADRDEADEDRLVEPTRLYDVRPDGVAVVHLHGICGRHLSGLAMACGGCDVDRVRESVLAADADISVRAIILDVDSPGGAVAGVAECADAVARVEKPCIAYAADQCASAAYWIASQADLLIVGPTADIGSVGVYCALLDESRAYDAKGLKVEMLSSGANKGVGYPGTALTDEQRATLQGQVDYVADLFKAAVLRGRAGDEPSADILDGRCLVGGLAVETNLADGVGDMEAAVSYALTMAANQTGVNPQ